MSRRLQSKYSYCMFWTSKGEMILKISDWILSSYLTVAKRNVRFSCSLPRLFLFHSNLRARRCSLPSSRVYDVQPMLSLLYNVFGREIARLLDWCWSRRYYRSCSRCEYGKSPSISVRLDEVADNLAALSSLLLIIHPDHFGGELLKSSERK